MTPTPITFPDPPLRANGVVVRGLLEGDAEAFSAAARDPSVSHGAFHDSIDMTDLDAVLKFIRGGEERMLKGTGLLLAVTDDEDRFLGQTMLFGLNQENLVAEMGFWIASHARGRGVATTAIQLTATVGFDELGLGRIFGLTTTDNTGSQRSMERAGMLREGVLRGHEKVPSGRWDMVSFGILSTDPVRRERFPVVASG